MSSSEHFPGEINPMPEKEAWGTLQRVITALGEAAESMEGNESLFNAELRRITSRLEIFRFDPEVTSLPDHRLGDAFLFVPANDQQEGLLAVESDQYGYKYVLQWRVLRSTEENTTTFWECALRSTAVEGTVMTFDQLTLPNEQVTPELAWDYLHHTIEAPGDVLSSLAPLRMAYVDADPGFILTEYYKDSESDELGLPTELIEHFFDQPE